MARPADPRKFQAWQRRLKRHATSGLSVARFCSRERVSVTTFQYWRQRWSRTAPEPSALTSPSVFSPVEFLSHRGVTIRFAAGAVMEIPEDRVDLVRAALGRDRMTTGVSVRMQGVGAARETRSDSRGVFGMMSPRMSETDRVAGL